jgi:small membrane protein
MEFTVIQGLAIVFALFALSRAILRFREHAIVLKELLFWAVIWIGVVLIAFVPGLTAFPARFFGIGRGVDALIYISIIVMFYLLFRMYTKIDAMERQITKVVRVVSLKDIDKKKKK